MPCPIEGPLHDAVRFNAQGENVHSARVRRLSVRIPRRHGWATFHQTVARDIAAHPSIREKRESFKEVQVHSASEAGEVVLVQRRTSKRAEQQVRSQVFVFSPCAIDSFNVVAFVVRSSVNTVDGFGRSGNTARHLQQFSIRRLPVAPFSIGECLDPKCNVGAQHQDVDDADVTTDAFDLVDDHTAEILPFAVDTLVNGNVHDVRFRSSDEAVDSTISP